MSAKEENYELARWLAGELSEAELKAFEQTPEYETYAKIATYSAQLEVSGFDADSIYRNTVSRKKAEAKVIPFYQSKWMKIAAIFVVLFCLSFFIKSTMLATEIAENGTKTSFSLPDDSQIVLNSGSEINYKKWDWDNNRKLDLNGEAYFKVAHGKKFEVNTKLGKVTVLGTQFDVKARGNRFDVTCYEGKVRVNYNNKEVVITKGTLVSFDNDYFELHTIKSTKPEWTVNQIDFKKVNIQTIIEEMERQYDCNIVLNSKNTQLFTGTLPANNIKTALEIVTSTFHLKISKFENQKYILEDF